METCCGEIAYPNDWNDCWKDFYLKNRLQFVIRKIHNPDLDTMLDKLHSKKYQLFDGAKVRGFLDYFGYQQPLWSIDYGQLCPWNPWKPR